MKPFRPRLSRGKVEKRTFVLRAALAPGEEYTLELTPKAVLDLQGNAYVPTTTDLAWKISTVPLIQFTAAGWALPEKRSDFSAAFVDDCGDIARSKKSLRGEFGWNKSWFGNHTPRRCG